MEQQPDLYARGVGIRVEKRYYLSLVVLVCEIAESFGQTTKLRL